MMIPKHRVVSSPGEILLKYFLEPKDISLEMFAEETGVPLDILEGIVAGERIVTPVAAEIFAEHFGTSRELWLTLDRSYRESLLCTT